MAEDSIIINWENIIAYWKVYKLSDELEERIAYFRRVLSDDAPLTALITLSAATATAGNRYRGITERVTEDDLIDNLSPMQIKLANRMAKTALTIGMRREEAEQDDDEVIDVVLNELRQEELKKKETSASPADSASDTD